MVADQLAAAAGENRRSFDKARPLLLVTAGGESSYAAAFRQDVGKDRGAAFASGIGGPHSAADFVTGLGGQGIGV